MLMEVQQPKRSAKAQRIAENRRAARRAKEAKEARERERVRQHHMQTVLAGTVRKRIEAMVREMGKAGRIDADVLDLRFWECIRCRFNPRKVVEVVIIGPSKIRTRRRVTTFEWWKGLYFEDRKELVSLSRQAGRPPAELNDSRIRRWTRWRGE